MTVKQAAVNRATGHADVFLSLELLGINIVV